MVQVQIQNFNNFSTIREQKRGGGVSIFTHWNNNYRVLTNVSFCRSYIECLSMKCVYNDIPFIVGSVYRPPNREVTAFLEALESIVEELCLLQTAEIFIGGDYKIDIIDYLP